MLARHLKIRHCSVKPLEVRRRRRAYRDIFVACLLRRCILYLCFGSKWLLSSKNPSVNFNVAQRDVFLKYLFVMMINLFFLQNVFSADTWTGSKRVDEIYTYSTEDTLYVYLNGAICPNVKNYFAINPAYNNNAKQLISMVLAAKMSGATINVLYDPESDTQHCYVKGLKLNN